VAVQTIKAQTTPAFAIAQAMGGYTLAAVDSGKFFGLFKNGFRGV